MITDEELAKLLRYDFSKGHEDFMERLLAQCLEIIEKKDDSEEEIDDDSAPTEVMRPVLSIAGQEDADMDSFAMELDDSVLLAVAGGVGGNQRHDDETTVLLP